MKKNTHRLRPEEPKQFPAAFETSDRRHEATRTGPQARKGWHLLPESLERFILHRRIDSFHKIWFLLFLHRHSNKHQISREYVRQVTFTDAPTLDEAIEELEDVGLLSCTGEVLSLDDAPDVRCQLDTMAHYFEDPTG